MPKTIYLPERAGSQGIDITWTPSRQGLDIGGWFDTFVGIETTSMTLRDFFNALGITQKDCERAWKKG